MMSWRWKLTAGCVASALALLALFGRTVGQGFTSDSSQLGTESQRDDNVLESSTDPAHPSHGSSYTVENHTGSRFLVIVSTMDGCVTALNGVTGAKEWSVNMGSSPLLSSSISKLEIIRGGQITRLIPSLDGGLYQFDGEDIAPIPLTADILLSSSFRFGDDLTVVGANEVESYGIDVNSGKVRYMCTSAGCKYFNGDNESNSSQPRIEETLVVTRNTKTLRTVEMQTGAEKWNFSVAQHDLTYISQVQKKHSTSAVSEINKARVSCPSQHQVANPLPKIPEFVPSEEQEAERDEQCDVETEVDDEIDDDGDDRSSMWSQPVLDSSDNVDIDLKVMVPNGQVLAVDRQRTGQIFWQHKCSSAIAAAWILRNQRLSSVSLFDDKNIPALKRNGDSETSSDQDDLAYVEPLLYIGVFENQLYVQPSVHMMQEVESAVAAAMQQGDIDMPRVRWRPYIATAPSRTPAVSSAAYPQIGYELTSQSTAMVQWHDQYPFDGGYYLFPDCQPVKNLKVAHLNVTEPEEDDITVSLLNWWKEVLTISVVMSVIVNLIVFKCLNKRNAGMARSDSPSNTESTTMMVTPPVNAEACEQKKDDALKSCPSHEYVSRYLTDFHQEACLGRGGFGVVFRARNQLDDCVYAVKRIALHDSVRAREKVTREVKALAKLEHPGIVRYYQSWFECPPPGWQEDRDKLTIDSSLTTPSVGISPVDGTSSLDKNSSSLLVLNSNRQSSGVGLSPDRSPFNPLNPFGYHLKSSVSMQHDVLSKVSEASNCTSLESSLDLSNVDPSSLDGPPNRKSETDSGTENDSFEISFRDESGLNGAVSSAGDSRMSDSHGENSEQPESSFSIVFEASNAAAAEDGDEDEDAVTGSICSHATGDHVSPPVCRSSKRRPLSLDLAKVSRPNISNTHSSTGKDGIRKLYLYIQMQLCQTESLKDWLGGNTLNRDKRVLLDIFHQIVSAIGYVHNCGLMHRDLKPSNIFFAMDGSVKIGDFGLVTAVEENCCDRVYSFGQTSSHDPGRHTDQVGTKLYMSPEQCAGRKYTHKVDIYALGMIFFELFYPFATEMERVKTLLDVRNLSFPQRFLRELSEEARFVRPLLSHDPSSRPSAKEILNDPIVVDFEEASQAYRRLQSQSRCRTMSNSSGNSTTEGTSLCVGSRI